MEISEEFYTHVDKVAKSTSYKWTDLDWEDIRQDMWVHFLERPNEMWKILEDDTNTRDKKLRRVGTQVAVAELHGYEQYSGQYIYGRDEVRAMLELGIPFKNADLGTATERVDLSLALMELRDSNLAQFTLLTDRYFKGEYDSTPAKRKMMERALDNITQLMNQVHNFNEFTYEDGLGARTVLSNSASVGITGEWS
jgi:hypothetical protein